MKHGFDVINFNGVEVPTFTFGGGNIRVTSGWEDGDGLDGVVFSLAPENTEVGEVINPELEGQTFDQIPGIKCYMRFSNADSIDVVIGKLEDCKAKISGFANKGGSEQNMRADAVQEELLVALERVANFMRGMQFDPSINGMVKDALTSKVSEIDELTASFNEGL